MMYKNLFPLTRSVFFISGIIFILLLSACNDDEDPGPRSDNDQDEVSGDFKKGIFVMNEGNFQWGAGSVSFIDTESREVVNNIFKKQNDRIPGNVVQSMTIFRDKGYIVVNNSQKIEVVWPDSFKSAGVIEGFNSPRYFLPVDEHLAYVSDLYENAVYIVNPKDLEITGKIMADGWTDEMILWNDQVFVAGMEAGEIFVFNVGSENISSKIEVLSEPTSMVMDRYDRIWVLCTGGFEETFPGIFRIDPATLAIDTQYTFSGKSFYPVHLTYDSGNHTFYYLLEGKIMQFNPAEGNFPGETFAVPGDGTNFNALKVVEQEGWLLAADARDYVSKGRVIAYDLKSGNKLHEWEVGTIPGNFVSFNGL